MSAQGLPSAWFDFCAGLIKVSVWVVLSFRACCESVQGWFVVALGFIFALSF